jgi:hypothetical protein
VHYQLDSLVQQCRQSLKHDVTHLLMRKTIDETDQGNVVRTFQVKFLLDRRLADPFSRHAVDTITFCEVHILGWIPYCVVDTVQDSDEIVGARPEETIKSDAVLRCQDLSRIGGADRCKAIRIADAGLQERNLAVEFSTVGGEKSRRQSNFLGRAEREISLICHVMDGEDRRRARRSPERKICRNKPSVPVIGMRQGRTPL